MSSARRPRTSRSLLAALAALVVLPVAGWPTLAVAEEGATAGDTVVGELVQAWPEYEDHAVAVDRAEDGPLSWVETGDGEAVRISTEDLSGLVGSTDGEAPVGATVEVLLGEEVEDPASREEGLEPAREVLAAEVVETAAEETAPAGTVTNEVTVVMMYGAGGAPESGRTLQQVLDAVNGPAADFWDEQTGGQVRVATAPVNYDWEAYEFDCSNPYALWNLAASRAQWTGGAGKHLLVYLPRNTPGCSYGLATIGAGRGAGGRLYVTDVATSVIAHEFGHNFSLGHSSGRQCDSGPEAGSCRDVEYRDYYDVMGVSGAWVGSLSPPHAARLTVLPAGQVQTVTSPTTPVAHTLSPYGGSTGTRVLRLTGGDGVDYWLEYRTAVGQDAWLGTGTNSFPLQQGVLLRRSVPSANTSLLLDATPSAAARWSSDWAVALPVGVPVAAGAFTVTVQSITGAGASVRVGRAVDGLRGDPDCSVEDTVPASAVALAPVRSTVHAFGIGTDRQLWYRPVAAGGGWQSLGGVSRYGPAAVSWSSATFAFVVGGDGALYARTESGSGWGPWAYLGGYLTSSPAVASLGDGHLRVFGRGADDGLWTREYAFGAWSNWSYLGGGLTSAPAAAAYPPFGQVEVSVRGTDGRVYTLGLPIGGRSGAYIPRDFTACSILAVPAVTTDAFANGRVYLDDRQGLREISRSGSVLDHGGVFTSNPAVQYVGWSTVLAGTGGDGALWVYDNRPGGVGGWLSLGGQLR